MHGPIEEHIEAATLENYSLQVSSREALEDVECHLQVCAVCRERLQEIEPFNMAHFIQDGLIYSRITQLQDGHFWAQHWGCEIQGGVRFRELADALTYLLDSFIQMFPEHECSKTCTQARTLFR